MNYEEFVGVVIDDGVEAAREDYSKPGDKIKLDGSLKGFEECRGKTPKELCDLLEEASRTAVVCAMDEAEDYWYWQCRQAEVEWVCNVLGAAVGFQIGGAMVTARGVQKAVQVRAKGDGYLAV